jgi:hypothetical protein
MASRRTYQKLSSNGFDLFELEPKPVDHRRNRIYLTAELELNTPLILFGSSPPLLVPSGFSSVRQIPPALFYAISCTTPVVLKMVSTMLRASLSTFWRANLQH